MDNLNFENVFNADEANIKKAAEIIRRGGIVSFPTETVYGLGADGFNPQSCARIFEIKERPRFDPLILHACSAEMAMELFSEVPEKAEILMEKFWPGPLTLVLPKGQSVPDIVSSGLPTVAVRVPNHPAALALIRAAERPIAAPSANKFGRLSPTTAIHVAEQLGSGPDMILDAGRTSVGVESTIITFHEGHPVLLRAGGLAAEEIENALGEPVLRPKPDAAKPGAEPLPMAPGCLKKHYAPKAELRIIRRGDNVDCSTEYAYIAFCQKPDLPEESFRTVRILSASGKMSEAAANLFYILHELENIGVRRIYAEEVPQTGLGLAIMDRLKRGAAK